MAKPESYPFFRIAKKYNVDYSRVLELAEYIQHEVRYTTSNMYGGPPWEIAVAHACSEQMRIRMGWIDWNTGERIPLMGVGVGDHVSPMTMGPETFYDDIIRDSDEDIQSLMDRDRE